MSESNHAGLGSLALGIAYSSLALVGFAGFGALLARWLT
jgi:hypothetical protein